MAKPASSRSSEPGCMCRPHNFIIVLWWSLSAESSLHATNLDIPDQTSLRPNRLSLTGGVMGQRPTQGDEKRLLFGHHFLWKRDPALPFVISTGAPYPDFLLRAARDVHVCGSP
jgi:hypothetical protein